jgi:hypothetical protein
VNRLLDIVSRLLDPEEREAVRGDLEESAETGVAALRDLLGLVARRQVALWKDWRPWLGFAGVVIPLGILLNEIGKHLAHSTAIYAWMYLNNWTARYLQNAGFRNELLHYALWFALDYATLMCWSWTVGFVLGSLSRRAIWVNGAAFCLVLVGESLFVQTRNYGVNAAAFAVEFYRSALPLILLIILILIPGVLGMYKGSRERALSPIQLMVAVATLASLTAWRHFPVPWELRLMLPLFLWPVAYMIGATAWRHSHRDVASV